MAESEWGRLNAGQTYGILAVDVDRALACANLRDYEAILMQHIREHSWGTSARRKRRGEPWPEAAPFRPDLSALARELGVPLPRLSDAKGRLIRALILVESDGRLAINKAAHEWLQLDGKGNVLLDDAGDPVPRLDRARLAYAARGCDRRDDTPKPPIFNGDGASMELRGSVSEVTPMRNEDATNQLRGSVTLGYADAQPELRGSVSEVTHRRNPLSYSRACVLDPTGLDPTGLEESETRASDRDDDATIPNGPSPQPERDAVVRFVDELTSGSLLPWASAAVRIYPAGWVRRLVERKVPGNPIPKANWLNAILQSWTAAGRCEFDDGPATIPMQATGTGGGYVPPSVARQHALMAQADRMIAEAEAREREASNRE